MLEVEATEGVRSHPQSSDVNAKKTFDNIQPMELMFRSMSNPEYEEDEGDESGEPGESMHGDFDSKFYYRRLKGQRGREERAALTHSQYSSSSSSSGAPRDSSDLAGQGQGRSLLSDGGEEASNDETNEFSPSYGLVYGGNATSGAAVRAEISLPPWAGVVVMIALPPNRGT